MNRTPSVRNPEALADSYLQLFLKSGGAFTRKSVQALGTSARGWRISGNGLDATVDGLVIACGPWSNSLLAPLGVRLPIIQERGYHMMFGVEPGRVLNRSIVDPVAGFVLTPMDQGIRATTGSNITVRERPPNPVQLDKLKALMRRTFPLGEELLDAPWMGRRISTPDSLPLIGPLTDRPGLFIATGHGHLGLTLAPVTAEWLADEIEGNPSPSCRPFYPDRT